MADVAVENKETPVVEDVTLAKKVEAVATENGVADAAEVLDVPKETKANGTDAVKTVVAEISPAAAAIIPDADGDKVDANAAAATTPTAAEESEVSAVAASADGVDAVTTAATIVAGGKADEAETTTEKSNGDKKDDVVMAEVEPTEGTNGDSSTDSPAEAVKRKIVDGKLDEAAAAAVTAEKKAKLDDVKEDVTNGGADPTEVAA